MSNNFEWEDEYAEDYLEEQECCDYGFEFCWDPQIKAMGLCTTECPLYLDSLEDEKNE